MRMQRARRATALMARSAISRPMSSERSPRLQDGHYRSVLLRGELFRLGSRWDRFLGRHLPSSGRGLFP